MNSQKLFTLFNGLYYNMFNGYHSISRHILQYIIMYCKNLYSFLATSHHRSQLLSQNKIHQQGKHGGYKAHRLPKSTYRYLDSERARRVDLVRVQPRLKTILNQLDVDVLHSGIEQHAGDGLVPGDVWFGGGRQRHCEKDKIHQR